MGLTCRDEGGEGGEINVLAVLPGRRARFRVAHLPNVPVLCFCGWKGFGLIELNWLEQVIQGIDPPPQPSVTQPFILSIRAKTYMKLRPQIMLLLWVGCGECEQRRARPVGSNA